MDIKLNFTEDHSKIHVSITPIAIENISKLFVNERILEIENIHICLWNNKEDLIIDIHHSEIVKKIKTFYDILKLFDGYAEDDYSINKLSVLTENYVIKYDDDSFLRLETTMKESEYEQKLYDIKMILNQYLEEMMNIKNLGLLW